MIGEAQPTLLITGLPGSGKTSLARYLAQRHRAMLIAKDTIKEPLLDALGASERASSRALSDASFTVLFALAREQSHAASGLVLEGNFRPAEHSTLLAALLGESAARALPARCAQVLCRIDEPTRLARLAARAADPARHKGHRDAELAVAPDADFLQIPGARFVFTGFETREWPLLCAALDNWWGGPRP